MKNVSDYINRKNVCSLLGEIVGIYSPYFKENEIMNYVHNWLKERELPAEYHEYSDDKVTGIKGINIIGKIGNKKGLNILINGHLDTVYPCEGWNHNPTEPKIIGDKFYGLGALDMKSGCVAALLAIHAFNNIAREYQGSIEYQFVSDEEGPFGLGTHFLIEDGYGSNADLAIVPEPSAGFTDNNFPCLCLGARGGYNYSVELTGNASHAASPEKGISAIVDASKLILELKNIKLIENEQLGSGDTCIIGIEGGGAACSVADKSKFTVFRHIVPNEDKNSIIKEVQDAAKRAEIHSKIEIKFREAPSDNCDGFMPYVVETNHQFTKELLCVMKKVTGKEVSIDYFNSIGDFNYLGSRLKIPTFVFGPSGKNYHSANEYVMIDDIVKTSEIIFRYLWKLLEASS